MALQQDQALETNPLYVLFALLFILFGLAVIAAVLNLMLLKFMTMNTIDENRSSFLIALFVHFEINISIPLTTFYIFIHHCSSLYIFEGLWNQLSKKLKHPSGNENVLITLGLLE